LPDNVDEVIAPAGEAATGGLPTRLAYAGVVAYFAEIRHYIPVKHRLILPKNGENLRRSGHIRNQLIPKRIRIVPDRRIDDIVNHGRRIRAETVIGVGIGAALTSSGEIDGGILFQKVLDEVGQTRRR